MLGTAAVLDVGKTNVKLELFAPDGALLWERSTPNRVMPAPPYPHADVDAIWAFLIEALRDANAAHRIGVIAPTTHGCGGAFVDDVGLVLPVLDYEFAGVEEIDALYASLRPPYAETLSPRLPGASTRGGRSLGKSRGFPRPSPRPDTI